jgi:hypothetical protein
MKYYRQLSIVLLLILIGMNIKVRINAKPQINPALVPYVETFKRLCKTYKTDCSKVDNFKIELVEMKDWRKIYKMLGIGSGGYIIGHCWKGSNEIDINIGYFKRSSPAEIEQLVIHELGHCVLDLDHTEETLDIMNSYTLPAYVYLKYYNEFVNRFFSCQDFCPVVKFNQESYQGVVL